MGIGGRGQHAANAGSLTPRAMWALPGPECQLPATLLRATSSLPDVPWCVWHTTLAPSPPQAPWFLPQLSVAAQSLCWGGGGISEMDSSTPKGGDRGQTTATSGTDLAACLSNPTRPFHRPARPTTQKPGIHYAAVWELTEWAGGGPSPAWPGRGWEGCQVQGDRVIAAAVTRRPQRRRGYYGPRMSDGKGWCAAERAAQRRRAGTRVCPEGTQSRFCSGSRSLLPPTLPVRSHGRTDP